MASRVRQLAACGIAGFLLLLITLSYGHSTQGRIVNRHSVRSQHTKRADPDLSWRETVVLGPTHQNPALAPAIPIPFTPDEFGTSTNNLGFQDGGIAANNLTRRQIDKPNTGALYCTDGPCVDDSCCGPKGICGYGPDFCEAGCMSNCDATAMCGEYSEDANMPCGMKLCCSATGWCGTTENYCHNADPLHGTLPCQAGYGSCAITGKPSCAKGSGSSKGRKIGYFQSWNVRNRLCNRVSPKQLDTTGYTHLFFSFGFIDPNSFSLVPAHDDDVAMMKEFTDLSKDRDLKTWIAVGGFDFSNPNASTHKTWSQMVSTKANRAAFISSAKSFMDTHRFSGIDLDWEYPGAPERGGNKLADTRGLSALAKEMRAAFGTAYGISVTLAPDYWYLRWFDAKAIEPHVDFLGFMAYDLHGSWDADVKALGKKVRGQADIREIEANTVPLWFDGVNPSKVNFGLAMYGRGYTLADPSCSDLLCPFAGPSLPAPCTNSAGVMSLVEIEQLIKKRNLTPKFLEESLMKQITWDDQWIGYDDEETFAAKRDFADGLCFGGTMIWSIDFQVAGSGGPDDDVDAVYLAPEVYEGTPAQCTGPCQLVFPPRPLGSTTTISLQPYTTSIQLKPGVTTTLTVKPPPIVTDSIEYYNVNITSNEGTKTITPIASVTIVPVTTTITLQGGETQVRTLTLPPWPAISGIPTGGQGTGGGNPSTTRTKTVATNPTTKTAKPLPPFMTSPFPTYPGDPDPSETQPSTVPSKTWPADWEIIPVETEIPEEGDEDNDDHDVFYVSCKLWFFSMCIDWPDFGIKIQGWKWNLPVGVYGPFPPPIPRMKLPPGFTLKGTLPTWPALTRAPDGTFSPPPKPLNCEPAEASFCLTTSAFATTVTNGVTRTTATQVKSTCATVTGCNVQDAEETKTKEACKLTRRDVDFANVAEATGVPGIHAMHKRAEPDWDCEGPGNDWIIVLNDRTSAQQRNAIKGALEQRDEALKKLGKPNGHHEARSTRLEYTAFFFVKSVGSESFKFLTNYRSNILKYYRVPLPGSRKKRDDRIAAKNDTIASGSEARLLRKRQIWHEETENWHLSMMSWDASLNFATRHTLSDGVVHDPDNKVWSSQWDTSLGTGQTIYVVESDWPLNHPEYRHAAPREISPPGTWGPPLTDPQFDDSEHGFFVASYAVGDTVGVAANANLAFVRGGIHENNLPFERFVEAFLAVADDSAVDKNEGVVNMSFGIPAADSDQEMMAWIWCELMKKMEDDLGIVFVLAGNYEGRSLAAFPDRCMPYLEGGILTGAVDRRGIAMGLTPGSEDPDIFAPGVDLPYPEGDTVPQTGTSYAAPLVAGLVAYFRALPGAVTDIVTIRSLIINAKRAINGEDGDLVAWNLETRADADSGDDDPCWSDGGNSNDRKRSLYGRQSCDLPGGGPNPRGPVVSYKPGPPAPLCTANCGKLCNGFYCVPSPTGTPPDFESPTPKPTTTAGDSNTETGNGGDGFPTLTGAPTLPSNPGTTAPPGQVCLSSTTATECNGGLHGGVCVTSTKCASFGQPPPNTNYISCSHRNQNPGQGIYTAFCVCDGSTFAESLGTAVTPYNSCAYTQKPTSTAAIQTGFAATTNTDKCQVCTRISPNQQDCTTLSNCTPKPTTPPSSPSTRCITGHSYEANCVRPGDGMRITLWDNGVEVCDVRKNLPQATNNADSVYDFDCGNGRSLTMTGNGERLTYNAPDGSITLDAYDKQEDWHADICAIGTGAEFEYVFDNGKCGNCPVQKLCNWTDKCLKFDGKCK